MTIELPMTKSRLELLEKVRAGDVTYANAAGRYCLNGTQVRGWSGRTLAALRRAGYITINHGPDKSTVELTEHGTAALPS
jgi:hypothetical protein